MLIVSLSNSRSEVEQRRAASDADHYGLVQGLGHAQGIEARRAFVGNGVTPYVRTLVQVMHDGRIARARTDHGMTYAVGHQQSGQYVYILLVAIHLLIVSSFASVSCHSCSITLSRSKPPPA